jgi:hypothetical protein
LKVPIEIEKGIDAQHWYAPEMSKTPNDKGAI